MPTKLYYGQKQQNFNPMKICASTVICTNLEKIPNSRTLTW